MRKTPNTESQFNKMVGLRLFYSEIFNKQVGEIEGFINYLCGEAWAVLLAAALWSQ